MNRRKFFKWLGVGIAGAAVAPSLSTIMGPQCVAAEFPLGASLLAGGTLSSYADYSSFSELALTAHIDEIVSQAAAELGAAAGQSIAALQMRIAEGIA